MNTYVILVFFIQVCVIKNTFGQSLGPLGPGLLPNGYPSAPFGYPNGFPDGGYPGAGWAAPYDLVAPYGGAGDGNVAVIGDLPVSGTTIITGQVPIMGAVSFAGPVPAVGTIVITGNCGCGCTNSPYYNNVY